MVVAVLARLSSSERHLIISLLSAMQVWQMVISRYNLQHGDNHWKNLECLSTRYLATGWRLLAFFAHSSKTAEMYVRSSSSTKCLGWIPKVLTSLVRWNFSG